MKHNEQVEIMNGATFFGTSSRLSIFRVLGLNFGIASFRLQERVSSELEETNTCSCLGEAGEAAPLPFFPFLLLSSDIVWEWKQKIRIINNEPTAVKFSR